MAIAVRQAHTLTPCHWPILNLCSPWPRAGADGADPAVLAQLPLALHRPLAALEQLLPARQAAPVRQDEEDDGDGGRSTSSPVRQDEEDGGDGDRSASSPCKAR